ncbi:MAG TPA: nucleotidyltransferase domain-containing protein [Flexistipes sinusarabici]|uniref:Nucleotidyltransferase domain-containing protein n=1 Tax=Flexistipes sinusarabici TaxID=2352 RepID=A0A3D5QEN6_FLESI|nr:nucleotidyltransferase domain-containing protein [Flexistipes sinusarabici]
MRKNIDIEKLKEEIVERLKPLNPDKIILFGSHASGNPDEDSDIDLYVVTNDDFIPKNYNEKMEVYLKIANYLQDFLQEYPTDLITHTRKMHEKFVLINSSFASEIMEKGALLYEKDHSRRMA